MADISQEIKVFKEAEDGEDVRDGFISLAEKVNDEVEKNTSQVGVAISNTNAAADGARTAANKAKEATDITNTATANANAATESTNAARDNILSRLADGEFKGDKGDQGDKGEQGESGVMAPSSGMFSLFLDPETGNLYADYPDGETPPAFEYEEATGNLYFVTG